MEMAYKIEEALGVIWEERERGIVECPRVEDAIRAKIHDTIWDELESGQYITRADGRVAFLAKGEAVAGDLIRRQRLAERLLVDVLEVDRRNIDSAACEFEHVISKEVEESICTLLGHPRQCPHGHLIPPGSCCAKAKEFAESVVTPLSKLTPGNIGRVVYMLTHEHAQIHKLMSLGIVPGALLSVHQTFPSFILKVDQTQIALEEDVANDIYIKRLRT